MKFQKITHQGNEYSLAGLAQSFKRFNWKTKDGGEVVFSIKVRYSDHCVSREIKHPEVCADGDFIFSENPVRVFCPDRYSCASMLVGIIDGLFGKPGTSVGLTDANRNWHTYQLYKPLGVEEQRRYCCFFSLKRRYEALSDGSLPLDLFVESAYPRGQRVGVVKSIPFGKVAELTWNRADYY